jgi:hypothetical protein
MAMPVGGFKEKRVNTGSKWQKLCFQDQYCSEWNFLKKLISEANLESCPRAFGMRNITVTEEHKISDGAW